MAIRTDFQCLLFVIVIGCIGLCMPGCKDDDPAKAPVRPDFVVQAAGFSTLDTISFENTSPEIDDGGVGWHWDFGNGRTSDDYHSHTWYDSAGRYVVKLSLLRDGKTESSKSDTLIIVESAAAAKKAPAPAFIYELPEDYYDKEIYAGTPLRFTDMSVDDGVVTDRQWIFGTGESFSGEIVEYAFNAAGVHSVTLTVTDDEGLSSDTTFQLSVRGVEFTPWQPGWLDIHHINTGRGDASFFIFPDGTNMLFDAGDKDVPGSGSQPDFPIHPNSAKPPGAWIADYISAVIPEGYPLKIDYMVISHFHIDHLGRINTNSPWSAFGTYRLGGVTQVGDLLPIDKIIDRSYPAYDFPVDLISDRDDIENYVGFLNYHKANRGLEVEKIVVGSSSQIIPLYNPAYDIKIINLYANGTFWTGMDEGETTSHGFLQPLVQGGEWNGNPLSIALKLEYGPFDYYTGGDITGEENWPDYDIETSLGKLVGEVDAMVLNHHGYKDGTNQNFVNALAPQLAIQQTSNVNHVNSGVVNRLRAVGADLYISNIAPIYATSALGSYYKSLEGHVVIRVYEGGDTFDVFILSDRSERVIASKKFGLYQSR